MCVRSMAVWSVVYKVCAVVTCVALRYVRCMKYVTVV